MKIGVFFGSRNPEHDISIITGQLIISGLRGLGYEVVPVYLSKKGEWLISEELGNIKKFSDPNEKIDAAKYGGYTLDLSKSVGKMVFRKSGILSKEIIIDLAFPALHGLNGEDGTIQGLFELTGVPYVGCDVASSAITMDKILTKQFYLQNGAPTKNFLFFSANEWEARADQYLEKIRNELKMPVFVKPASLGSSIGLAKARNEKELKQAIEVAFRYGERVLIEEAVENLMDLTCAVLGNTEPVASLLQESIYTKDLLSYEDKYLNDGGSQTGKSTKSVVIPARLDPQTTEKIRQMAVDVFKKLGCSGTARVDFLYDTNSREFFSTEVNTLPGTLYHHLWEKSGVRLSELLIRLITLAEERHKQKNSFITTFESDILKTANSTKLHLKKDKNQ